MPHMHRPSLASSENRKDEEQDYIFAQDFELIEDLWKAHSRRKREDTEKQFLPFFFEDYSGI